MAKQSRTAYNTRSRRKLFERRWSKRSTKGFLKFVRKALKLSSSSKKRLSTPPVPKQSFIPIKQEPLPPLSTTCPEPTRSFIRYDSDTMDIPDVSIPSLYNHFYHSTSMLNTLSFQYLSPTRNMTPETSDATISTNTTLTPIKETLSFKKEIGSINRALEKMEL